MNGGMRRTALVGLALVAGCSSAASVPSSPSPSGATHAAFSRPVNLGDATITVSAPTFAEREPGTLGAPAGNGVYAVFTVTYHAARSWVQHGGADFYVRGHDGTHYPDVFAPGFAPMLHGATMNADERSRGAVVFDVPTRHGVLVLAPRDGDRALSEWHF